MISQSYSTLNQLRQVQAAGDYDQAGALWASHIELLLTTYDTATLTSLLAELPPTLIHENRDLCYVEGLLLARAGDIQAAIKRLERARFSYTIADPQLNQAVRCSLELARLYCSREQFQAAYHHLQTEVEPLLTKGVVTDPALCARFYLRMAELTPDIGLLPATATDARLALKHYRTVGDRTGELRALLRLLLPLRHQGEFAEAVTLLTLAQECLSNGMATDLDRARVLNAEIHFHWYRGQLATALPLAEAYVALADRVPTSNFRVYARMLLGNLHRDLGHFDAAAQWYAHARQLIVELEYPLYTPWVDAQEAWQALVQGQWQRARTLIYAALRTADLGQSMSFQVTLALLHLQAGQVVVAERLLAEALAYYEQSGDELATCTLYAYQALIAHRRGQGETRRQQLTQAFGWLNKQHLDYLPLWWHPDHISELCVQALALDLYPETAERILLTHLRTPGKEALRRLHSTGTPAAAQRAYQLLQALGDRTADLVAHLPDEQAKRVLLTLLESEQLRPAAYPRLEQELITAAHHPKPNPTLLAVFGLYVNGVEREEIAEQLSCSLPTVRNYITAIYEHFGLKANDFTSRRARWKALVTLAQASQFIG
jgi:ATP/maltotriose-dependent transcriptional regulator MalT